MEKIGMEILQISPERIKFVLSGCDVSLANALRRILIAQVPTLAPHLVSIVENTSVLHDQFLCQRLGLIPFVSDSVDQFKYTFECPCNSGVDDCKLCKAYFKLQIKNLTEDIMEVTSMHISSIYEQMKAEDDEVRPVMPVRFYSDLHKGKQIGIPIVKLARNQQINIRFQVVKGIGKMHAKWSPVCLATFQPDPQVRIDQTIELTLDQKQKITDSCPKGVFEIHGGVFGASLPQNCIFCGECRKTAEALDMNRLKNLLRVGKKKDRFIFTVESVHTLSAAAIVKKAMAVLREKLKQIQESIN